MTDQHGTVLIIDDEETIREILGMYVTEIGFQFIEATNGEEGLELLKRHSPNVVVSDYTMPVMNGIELLRQSRLAGFNRPFIMLTGNGDESVALEALQLGAFDFLDKPFDAEHLMILLKDAMRKSFDIQTVQDQETSEGGRENLNGIPWDVDEKIREVQKFAEEFEAQLTFCISSVQNLLRGDKSAIELGFLFRTMQELSGNARNLRLHNLTRLANHAVNAYMFFRAHPEKLSVESITLLAKTLNNLLNQLRSLSNSDSISMRSFRIELELDNLKLAMGGMVA